MMIQKKYKILANLSEPQSLILLSKRDEQIIGYIGAWGCGKSFTAVLWLIMKAGVCSFCDFAVVGQTLSSIEDVIITPIINYLYDGNEKLWHKTKHKLKLPNNNVLHYQSYINVDRIESKGFAASILEEASYTSPRTFDRLLSRTRQKFSRKNKKVSPQMLVLGHPNAQWLKEKFDVKNKGNCFYVMGKTVDNIQSLGQEYIDVLNANLTEDDAKIYVLGQWGKTRNMVYPEWRRDIHLIDYHWNSNNETWMAVDFGFNYPAVLFFQSVDGNEILFDQLVPTGVSDDTLLQLILSKPYGRPDILKRNPCDPAGDNVQSTSGEASIKKFRAKGFNMVYQKDMRYRRIPFGVAACRASLRDGNGKAKFFVSRQMAKKEKDRGFVTDIEKYKFETNKNGDVLSDLPDKEEKHSDTMDAWRYSRINNMIDYHLYRSY